MHVARVVAVAVQPYRPTAVEPRRTLITTPQGVLPLADVITVACDRCGKDPKQRLNDGIVTARKVLSGLGTLAQRLIEKSMPVRVVQGVQVRCEFCQEAAEIGHPAGVSRSDDRTIWS